MPWLAEHRYCAVDATVAAVELYGDVLVVGTQPREYRQDLGQDRHSDHQPLALALARAQVDRLEVEFVALELPEAVLDCPALQVPRHRPVGAFFEARDQEHHPFSGLRIGVARDHKVESRAVFGEPEWDRAGAAGLQARFHARDRGAEALSAEAASVLDGAEVGEVALSNAEV